MNPTSRRAARPALFDIRRWVGGAILIAAIIIAATIAAPPRSDARQRPPTDAAFSNASGVVRTLNTLEISDGDNAFFQELGTNGRTCLTCHRPSQAWTITPEEVQERFVRTGGLDPIFRTNDSSNCENADVATVEKRRQAFSLLLSKGLIRIALDVPANAEFEIVDVDDPYRCGAPLTMASLYRRPLPTSNAQFLSTVMWDGRATIPGQSIKNDLMAQALDATIRHAEGPAPSEAQLRDIAEFELRLVTAQAVDRGAGGLSSGGANGGPAALITQPFCIGINDPFDTVPPVPGACTVSSGGLDPVVFTLFGAWASDRSPGRQAIARGEAIFNTREFVIDSVPGLNSGPQDPVSGPMATGTCTVCHNTPNAGNHSVPLPLNIGVSDASRRSPDMPLYTLRNRMTGRLVETTDPGVAMITGKWSDIGKFKGPILRGLAARSPFFHDGSAASLSDVIEFYDLRFGIGLTPQEKRDLLAFLQAL